MLTAPRKKKRKKKIALTREKQEKTPKSTKIPPKNTQKNTQKKIALTRKISPNAKKNQFPWPRRGHQTGEIPALSEREYGNRSSTPYPQRTGPGEPVNMIPDADLGEADREMPPGDCWAVWLRQWAVRAQKKPLIYQAAQYTSAVYSDNRPHIYHAATPRAAASVVKHSAAVRPASARRRARSQSTALGFARSPSRRSAQLQRPVLQASPVV